uniref:Uncharacterized protein n=3 Tax=Vibrio TaxID=662 RepID=A0A0H4A2K8_9VIBR|nr:hypothetical protein [Vibrio tasmaniensis]AKN39221.1 hypothetical protein [Vibrio splendidus]AKN39313.1 hypothetical protein [Vibrio sp. FF_286]AKN39964.1 hypothetical protein [Vibrio splendidus]AKN40031.1 hypothetical protein [Vibrio tasmaniensis]
MKVARWVLRETALGNKCRPPDRNRFAVRGRIYPSDKF